MSDPADTALSGPRFKLQPYVATIVNWHLSGSGDTPKEAIANLRQTFEAVNKQREVEGKSQPRPGTTVPIAFASQDRVKKHEALSDDFVRRILGLEWAWISDESSLWDFHADATNNELQGKIRTVYGVDVSDIESAKLSDILDRIASRQETAPAHI